MIWTLTFFLVLEAVERLRKPKEKVDGKQMLIFAVIGLVVNVILLSSLHDHDHNESEDPKQKNINLQAAILHALGDLLCSIGVVISSIVIYFKPEYQFVDPLCTFFFSFVVVCTTLQVFKNIVITLMEGKY